MAQDNSYFAEILDVEKPTDFEIAMYILRIMDVYLFGSPSFKNQDFERGLMIYPSLDNVRKSKIIQ